MTEVLHVLVVEHEAKMRLGMVRILSGYTLTLPELQQQVRGEVATADSPEEALQALDRQPVDVLLLDYRMTSSQGLDLLRRVREDQRDLVVVVMAAYAAITTAISATKEGAFDFLPKPFTPVELQRTVAKAARHLLLERHARQLEGERRQLRFQLISVVAHELKSPLNAIDSYLQLLNTPSLQLPPEKIQHAIERSLVRLDGMRKLINDLLDLTHIESGQRQRQLTPVKLADLVRQPLEMARQLGQAQQLTVSAQIPPDLSLQADPGEIEIILNNLLSNAVKYNRPGGSVTLSAEDRGDCLAIAVTDTGIGMTPEETRRLFGEFVRIKNKRTQNIPGSGLGLSIVRKLALLYGGDATVSSQPEVGSTFTVTLAKQPPPGPTPPPPKEA